jgi:hypothetical protein
MWRPTLYSNTLYIGYTIIRLTTSSQTSLNIDQLLVSLQELTAFFLVQLMCVHSVCMYGHMYISNLYKYLTFMGFTKYK